MFAGEDIEEEARLPWWDRLVGREWGSRGVYDRRGRGRSARQPCPLLRIWGQAVSGLVGGVVFGGMASLTAFHGADVQELALRGGADS